MKIEKNFFLLCENAVLDKDNRVTIVNIYDIVNSIGIPIALSQFTLAANFKVSREEKETLPSKIDVLVSIFAPSGKKIFDFPKQERKIDVKKDTQNIGILANIQGINLPEFGIYNVKLLINGNELAQLSFEAKKKQV